MSNQRYTEVFKGEAGQADHRTRSPRCRAEVAQRLGVSQHSLYQWIKARQHPPEVRQAQASQSEELCRLKAEPKRVTEERDILKNGPHG